MSTKTKNERVRIDKWLWAARFFKTRALAAEDIGHGRIAINGVVAKASREVHLGELIELRQSGQTLREVWVRGVSAQRGPATVAQLLYEETPSSLKRREDAAQARRQGVEPAQSLEQGRPTKRDRRQISDWQRWSASIDDDPA